MAVLEAARDHGQAPGDVSAEPAEHAFVTTEDVEFALIEVPGFDSGMEIAVVHGDPNAPSGDYTLRLAFPDGYRLPPHWHPKAEHLTVLSGTFLLAMGETADEAAIPPRPATSCTCLPRTRTSATPRARP